MRQAVVVAAGRSAVGKAPKGTLKNTRPEDISAQVIHGVLNKIQSFDYSTIEDLIIGCSFPEAEQGFNVARIVALLSGLSYKVPGQTVNRFCSSGLQSIASAANSIIAGQQELVLAGGMETMSMIPMGGNIIAPSPVLIDSTIRAYVGMGITAENVAEKFNITREQQDLFSYESHIKASKAQQEGKFDSEIIPVETIQVINNGKGFVQGKVTFAHDEGIRSGTTPGSLSRLKPVFKVNGSVTAGNSSQMSDGAAFVLIMESEKAESLGLKPLAAFKSFAVTGLEPEYMGLGPITAIPKVLKLAGLKIDDIDLFELNEAFAAQSIACINELKLPKEKVNVNGGAIAMGHPLGATGAILTVKLINELIRRKGKYGIVSMCIGGGMGAAGVYEIL